MFEIIKGNVPIQMAYLISTVRLAQSFKADYNNVEESYCSSFVLCLLFFYVIALIISFVLICVFQTDQIKQMQKDLKKKEAVKVRRPRLTVSEPAGTAKVNFK